MSRDPRVDPINGDVFDVIGWKVRVVLADLQGVAYFIDGGPAAQSAAIHEKPWPAWSEFMRHATILHTAEVPDAE